MLFEIREIQKAFMRHFKVGRCEDLEVPDGDYLVPIYDEYFNVRIANGRIGIIPDEKFDREKATRI